MHSLPEGVEGRPEGQATGSGDGMTLMNAPEWLKPEVARVWRDLRDLANDLESSGFYNEAKQALEAAAKLLRQ